MTTLTFETSQQAEAIGYLLAQGIELEKIKLETQHVLDAESIESRLRILHGENALTQLIIARLW